MTCAPRGISSTYSASVGRTAVRRALRVVRTVTPSSWSMMSSWASTPAWVWNSPPTARVIRCRRRFASTSSTRSPSRKTRATSAHLDGDRDRADLRAQPAESAHRSRRRRTAHRALPELVALLGGVAGEALVPALEEAEQERGLRSGRAVLQRVEHLLVAQVPVAGRHRALLDLVVDALQHAVRRHLALAQAHQGLDLAHEPGRRRQHRVLATQVACVPPEHVAQQHRRLVVEVVAGGDDVVAALDRRGIEEVALREP